MDSQPNVSFRSTIVVSDFKAAVQDMIAEGYTVQDIHQFAAEARQEMIDDELGGGMS